MSVFDGLAGTLNVVFGAPVTLTPPAGPPVTIRAIFRETVVEEEDRTGRVHMVPFCLLQVPRPAPAALVVGALVAPSVRPGQTWRVRGVWPDRSPAADAFLVAHLEPAS